MPELTLVYQSVKGKAPYIKNIPAYHHPEVFHQSPRQNTGIMATIPKLLGWSRDSVRTTAYKQGFNVRFETGGPAPSSDLAGKVESQSVPPGKEIPWGGTVVVKMYRKSLGLISVPNLQGLSGRDAQARLQEAGLGSSFVRGRAAPSERHSGMVESQSPSPGARVKRGEKIIVRVFGSYQDTRCYGIQEKLRSVRRDSDRLRYLRQAQQLACRIPNLDRELARVENAERQRRNCDNFLTTAKFARDDNQKLNLYRQARAMGCRTPGLNGQIATLEQKVQHDRQCSNLIQTANAARNPEQRLRILRQARSSRCQARGLNNAIASLEREVQRQKICNTLLQNAGRARSDLEKLNLYKRAKRNGCQFRGLDRTIASLENSGRQQRMCNDLVTRGNRAKSVHTKLSYYQNAKRRGCRVRGLDSAIANLNRQAQKERRCDQLLRNSARERNQQRRLGILRQAKREGCSSPGLNSAISSLERSTRPPARTPAPKPKPNPNVGVLLPGKGDNTRVCDCYDKQNGYYATFLGFCNAGAAIKSCIKVKGRTPGY